MTFPPDLVRRLHLAENDFLQVLLTRFRLRRAGAGVRLELEFTADTPAISSRRAKRHLHDAIPDFDAKSALYQRELDAVLIHRTRDSFDFADDDFPFRYASGGTLPIFGRGGTEYYAFFYRDLHPIGWNIANGGSDSRAEMLHPLAIVKRELKEELMVLDPVRKVRYVFPWDAGEAQDHALPVEWSDGPDTISIRIDGREPCEVAGCFVNVNATDFGIEVDRIVRIELQKDAVLLDGEIVDGYALDRPIGLFEVGGFDAELRRGAREFLPALFFHSGREHPGAELPSRIQGRCDLCPVTRSLVMRGPRGSP
jgi:hypothetical protein